MEITTKIIIDGLTNTDVSINTQTFIEIEGEQVLLKNHRKAYLNIKEGRLQLQTEQPVDIVTAVFAIWGDQPFPTPTFYNDENTEPAGE